MKLTFFITLLFSVVVVSGAVEKEASIQTAEKVRIRLTNRCRPANVQRDALCGCYACKVFGLSGRDFSRRCMMLFRIGMRGLRRSCNFYMRSSIRGRTFRVRRLIRNLRFIRDRCPRMMRQAGMPVSVALLSNVEVINRIDEVLQIIRDMLEHLDPPPTGATVPPSRMLVTGEKNAKRVARLAMYNNIKL